VTTRYPLGFVFQAGWLIVAAASSTDRAFGGTSWRRAPVTYFVENRSPGLSINSGTGWVECNPTYRQVGVAGFVEAHFYVKEQHGMTSRPIRVLFRVTN
jgi:hypothetical protein